jgi:hypothetical protein
MLSQQPVFKKVVEVRYQRFLLIAHDRGVHRLRRSEMRKHHSSKPTAVAAIGRVPLVLVYGWGLFGFIYSWRSSLISSLSSFSSYLICLSRSFSIFLPFYLLSFLSYLNLESSLVRFIDYHRMSWSRMLSLSSPWPPTNGVESISAGPNFLFCSVVRRHWDMPISFAGSSWTCTY